ncbi:NAD(P)-binding domain superfamily protein, partial [Pleurotus pulmonarius]
MQISTWAFINAQWRRVPPVEKDDLSGKTVVVIGANTGIGYETAKHFATMNPARLIMGCRNQEKGAAAVADLKESTGFHGVELWLIDLCSLDSVRAFADKFEEEVERL